MSVPVSRPEMTWMTLKTKSSEHSEAYGRGPAVTFLSSFNEAITTLRRIQKLWDENQKAN